MRGDVNECYGMEWRKNGVRSENVEIDTDGD